MLQKYFDIIIYNSGNWSLTVGNLVFFIIVLTLLIWGFHKTKSQLLPSLYKRYKYLQQDTGQINKTLIQLFIISALSLGVEFMHLNVMLLENNHISLSFTSILMVITIFFLVKLALALPISCLHSVVISFQNSSVGCFKLRPPA